MNPTDDGYISQYLIHWAGRNKTTGEKVAILSQIASTCRLLLSVNEIFFDHNERISIIDKMVCFTDVPLSRSERHCEKYSNFGIAFTKMRLYVKGAQPVFYFTQAYNKDMEKIYRFIRDQMPKSTIDDKVKEALHRHFYFMQKFSKGYAGNEDAYYYEREWRIGELCLRPNGKDRGIWPHEHGLTPLIGTLITEGDEKYFQFDKSDVAFLIAPQDSISEMCNPLEFDIRPYEEIIRND